jgi:2'-5' RNA ligase
MIRLFVALSLPETVKRQLAMLQGGVPGARWSTDEQLHLTLRFIGEVDEGQARDIDETLSTIEHSVFPLELAGVGEFGGKNPHMLWAGTRPNEKLMNLQRKIETALQRLGLAPESRKYTPHVTVARLRGTPMAKLREFLSAHALFSSLEFRIENFALYSSQLSSHGSIYRVEREYPLRK